MSADCLPVLLCDERGCEVAAVHAGWRGLAAGIVANAVDAFSAAPPQLSAWLGPAICARHFEVGSQVREAFVRGSIFGDHPGDAFVSSERAGHFYCDLYALATMALRNCGVERIYGGEQCTYHQSQRFFSYRREGVCGRMATVIALRPTVEAAI